MSLQRRLKAKGAPTIAVAAHPGFSDTELMRHLPASSRPPLEVVTQPAEMGALGTLRAATDPAAQGGEYYGPDGVGELQGIRKSLSQAHNRTMRIFSADCGRYPRSSPA